MNVNAGVSTRIHGGFPRLRLITMATAIVCAGAALLVSTEEWATWFAHPAVDEALTRGGAALWRVMIGVTAVMLVIGPIALMRLVEVRGEAGAPEQETRVLSRKRLWWLLALVMVGLIIRGWRINESLWYDEIASWMTYNAGIDSSGAVVGSFLDPINHVLHTLLNRWSVALLSEYLGVEPSFRLPSLLFSLLAIPMMFLLGREAVSERAGWIAATLAAIVPVGVLEGVEARGYAQMIFFSAAATWLFLRAFRGPARFQPWLWMVYAICCALGVWSQFVTAWIAIGHGMWLAWCFVRRREDRRRCVQGFIALLLAGTFSITLYAPMIPGMLAWKANFLASSPDQPRLLSAEGLHALLQLGGAWSWWSAAPGLAALMVGVAGLSRKRPGARDALALALLGLPLMVLAVALSGSWLYARFMLFAIPGALLAMAAGIDSLWSWRRGAGIAALALIISVSFADLVVRPSKQPLREAMTLVNRRANPGDHVLEVGVAHSVLRVYARDDVLVASRFFHGRDLAAKLDALQPRWVVVEYPLKVKAERYAELDERGYVVIQHFDGWADWGHGDIEVLEKPQREAASGNAADG
jgi:mannosyltransferase